MDKQTDDRKTQTCTKTQRNKQADSDGQMDRQKIGLKNKQTCYPRQ